MISTEFQQPLYSMVPAPMYFGLPLQPSVYPGFLLPPPIFGHQNSYSSVCAEPSKPLAWRRSHVCPVRMCGKRFTTSGNLSRHKRLHGKIDPLECPVADCVCTFPSNNKLEKHMKFHYGGAVKACLVTGCGRTFSTTGNLNRHMKHHHSDMTPSEVAAQAISCKEDSMKPVKVEACSSPTSSAASTSDTESDASSADIWKEMELTPTPASALPDNLWSAELLETLATLLDDAAPESELAQEL